MNKIEIELPEGFEFDKEKFEKEFFVKKKKRFPGLKYDLSTHIKQDVFHINSFAEICTSKAINDANSILTKELAKAFIALMQLVKYRDIWNKGWKPDWTDESCKYHICSCEGKIDKGTSYVVSEVLHFKREDVRDEFLSEFITLIEIAKPLI